MKYRRGIISFVEDGKIMPYYIIEALLNRKWMPVADSRGLLRFLTREARDKKMDELRNDLMGKKESTETELVDIDKLKSVLIRAREYANAAGFEAEAKHDDIEGEYYMDSVQYEIVNEAKELIADIDSLLKELT